MHSNKGVWFILLLVVVIAVAAYVMFSSMQVLYSPAEFEERTSELFIGIFFIIIIAVIGLLYFVFYFVRNWL